MEIADLLPELRVLGLETTTDEWTGEERWVLVVRNEGSLPILAWTVQTEIYVPDVLFPGASSTSVDHQLRKFRGAEAGIRPGELVRLPLGLAVAQLAAYDDGRRVVASVPLAIFDDGTYSGDADMAVSVYGMRLDGYDSVSEFLCALESWLGKPVESRTSAEVRDLMTQRGYHFTRPMSPEEWVEFVQDTVLKLRQEKEFRRSQLPASYLANPYLGICRH